jgi:hypothetical protein
MTAGLSHGQSARSTPPEGADKIIKLYPNPATTYITFDFQKGYEKGLSVEIFSFIGKKMYEGQNLSEKVNIDLAEFTRGVYIYHLRDGSGKIVESGKFQVAR